MRDAVHEFRQPVGLVTDAKVQQATQPNDCGCPTHLHLIQGPLSHDFKACAGEPPFPARARWAFSNQARNAQLHAGSLESGCKPGYPRFWRFQGPVMASRIPGFWMLANSVLPSGEKVTPANSLNSGSSSVPTFRSLRAMG